MSLRVFVRFILICFTCSLFGSNPSFKEPAPLPVASEPFFHLKEEELSQDWAKEYRLGFAFLRNRELDLALYSLKRAFILLPNQATLRKKEVEYGLIFAYYLSQNYSKAIHLFETSALLNTEEPFSMTHDLLFLLYACYEKNQEPQKADLILKQIEKVFPEEGNELHLAQALHRGDIEQLRLLSSQNAKRAYLVELFKSYQQKLKSPKVAQWLGALCPGAGYLYAGQPKTAMTSFLINGLLIAASTQLFITQFYTLGVLAATFEAGWYIGGILGGRDATKTYNHELYRAFENKVNLQECLTLEQQLEYEL